MNLVEKFTVLEDGMVGDTFGTYKQAVDHMREHAVKGHKYQVVKELVSYEESLPTVADTGWKPEYIGMWADVDGFGRPQLIFGTSSFKDIAVSDFPKPRTLWVDPAKVCPRYDLARVSLTPHPAYLKTIEDYEGAPEYTIISSRWNATRPAMVKDANGYWTEVDRDAAEEIANPAGVRRKVLYWPPQEEGGASA